MDNEEKWLGHRLLVPMRVDAMVRTDKGNGTVFSAEPMSFKAKLKYDKIQPDPFKVSPMPESGIHLKWALLDGLTNAVQNEAGDFDYPLVPNRWIVIRFSAANPNERQAFIVSPL